MPSAEYKISKLGWMRLYCVKRELEQLKGKNIVVIREILAPHGRQHVQTLSR